MESPPSFPALPPPPPSEPKKTKRFPIVLVVGLLIVGLLVGGGIGYAVTYNEFNNKLTNLQAQLGLYDTSGTPTQTYLLNDNVSLATLYQHVKSSVVVIRDLVSSYTIFGQRVYTQQQGSGFVTIVDDQKVIVTNNHVVEGAINITVTFADGETYTATVLGQDAKADLAVLSVSNFPSSAKGLSLLSSSTLSVGDPVVAVGSPYGLSGTLTTGIVSALGRTIVETSDNGKDDLQIPDTIQTSTPINSGNSGGPLITYSGAVVGITTAGISDSEGLGFAIPSDTIMRELPSLIATGSYDQHPSLNAVGTDMTYQIAQAMGTTTTYGWLVETVSTSNGLQGGNTRTAILGSQVVLGGDIIIGINNQRITNGDELRSYLERHTLPGETVSFTVVRAGQTQTVSVSIGTA
jgi:S1-C subfamily serine protease